MFQLSHEPQSAHSRRNFVHKKAMSRTRLQSSRPRHRSKWKRKWPKPGNNYWPHPGNGGQMARKMVRNPILEPILGHSSHFCGELFPHFAHFRSGPGKPNQRKVGSWTFRRGIPEQKFNVNRACFPKEKHQNSQERAKFMNCSFWPFLWFGLLGRLLTIFLLRARGPRSIRLHHWVSQKLCLALHFEFDLRFSSSLRRQSPPISSAEFWAETPPLRPTRPARKKVFGFRPKIGNEMGPGSGVPPRK